MKRVCMAMVVGLIVTSVVGGQTRDWKRTPWSDLTRGNWKVQILFQMFDSVYYVGTEHVSSYLITTPGGLVLIDTTNADTVDGLLDNVRQLGFDPSEIEYVFITHPHDDHYGGVARIQEETGATIGMSGADWEFFGAARAPRGSTRVPLDHEHRAAPRPRDRGR